jgi:signal transduction histidine kinase
MTDTPATLPGKFSAGVRRRLLAIFLPAVLLTGAVVVALSAQDLANEHALYCQAADHRVELHADRIRREFKAVESDLLYLANQALLADFLAGRPGSREELQNEYLLFCRQRGVYDQIRFLDATGDERVRINFNNGRPAVVPQSGLQAKAARYYFVQTLQLNRGEVFCSPFDLNVEHEAIERPIKPVVRFGTPVFDRQGTKRGIVILNYLGAGLIDQLARVSAGFPGSVWFLNRDGYFLRGPTPEDEWGFMLGHDRTFATYFPDEWPRLGGLARGQFETARGLFTFRTLSLHGEPAPDADVIVVAHIPPHVLGGRTTLMLRRLLLLAGVVLVVVLVLAWYLAYAGAVRCHHERNLAESAARLRTLSTRLLTAQEDERRSVARDLHDELGQVVTSVTLDLQRAAQAGDAERKAELIGRALHGTTCLLDRIHEITARLRPTLLDDLGLRDAVRSYLGEFERRTGIVVQAELDFDTNQINPAVSENLYRILQEALTNVTKHAQAAEVFIGLHVTDRAAVLTVRDAGVGIAPGALDGKRLGVLGMRERAELLDGTFVLKSEPGQGTEVQVTIPMAGA